VRWSEAKSETEDGLSFNYRKLAVAQIYCLMSHQLHALFNPFYGYVYESFIGDLQAIQQSYEDKAKDTPSKGLKRQREPNSEFRDTLIELYLGLVLDSFQVLFQNDKEHEFLDSVKIEALGDPLSEIILLAQHQRFR
jgi:hypothetical protein